MLRLLIALAACAILTASVAAAAPIELKSVAVRLPDSDSSFPPGPGSDVTNQNCLACHSADMVLNQPGLPKAAWEAVVNKMINTYKAPIARDDIGTIVDYLSRLKATN